MIASPGKAGGLPASPSASRSLERWPLILGHTSLAVLVLAAWSWGFSAPIAGAILADGRLEAALKSRVVMLPEGGEVLSLNVKAGQAVRMGETLLTLDGTELEAELTTVETELHVLLAEQARLKAKAQGSSHLATPELLDEDAAEGPAVAALMSEQNRLHVGQQASLERELDLLELQRTQNGNQQDAMRAELEATRRKHELLSASVERAELNLAAGHLVREELESLQRELFTITGDLGTRRSRLAELVNEGLSLELRQLSIVEESRASALDELARSRGDRIRLVDRRSELRRRIERLQARSPVDGVVHDVQVQGPGALVGASTALMTVVPDDQRFIARVQVRSEDVDHVRTGQEAGLELKTLSKRSAQRLHAKLQAVSADTFVDPLTREHYYEVQLELSASAVAESHDLSLVSGMPVSAYIYTDTRTPAEYVIEPIARYAERAFRDP